MSGDAAQPPPIPPDDASGAYRELLGLLADLEASFDRPGRGWDDEVTRAEGYVHLLDLLATGLEFFLHGDADRPAFIRMITPVRKFGGDNTDSLYHLALLNPTRSYRITGRRGDECYLGFCVYGGRADGSPAERVVENVNHTAFAPGPGDSFELILSARPELEPAIELAPDTISVIARQYFFDPATERPASFTIEVVDGRGEPAPVAPPPPLSFAAVADRLRAVANHVRGWTGLAPLPAPDSPDAFNTICEPHQAAGPWSTPDNLHAYGFYRLEPGQVLELRGRSPESVWWGVQVWNQYMQSYDARYHRVSLNARQITLEPDGSWRIFVGPDDPGEPNWVDTAGHLTGFVYFRWQLADGSPSPISAAVRRVG
ncbi:DUF1214 domain-containing protein [Rhabdothermincola sediminis]|uniref:DUF1214 domain-containing protein n=1 Tax=Rhabdothermincola sediminis TaxID=2751370 RepID=UPI001AA0775B|nr:DUF1214 domain-containing protein [Rhabdothermincola sediminis]